MSNNDLWQTQMWFILPRSGPQWFFVFVLHHAYMGEGREGVGETSKANGSPAFYSAVQPRQNLEGGMEGVWTFLLGPQIEITDGP